MSSTRKKVLLSDLEIARNFYSRGVGLLGRRGLSEQQGLWIHRCMSIHTFFMNFTIDCVFIDKNMVIQGLYSNIAPWRLVWPVWKASSVIEMSQGSIQRLGLQLGEQLHVGT